VSIISVLNSRAMAQALSILPLVAEAHVQINDSLRGIFGGRNFVGSGLSLSTSLSFAQVTICPITASYSFIHLLLMI
jgi:hypothetical protein